MLTSAPFDNWWHNAYGLDVRIISPPHTLLAIGIFAIVVGALLLTLAQQNRADDDRRAGDSRGCSPLTGGMLHHELRAVPHGIQRARMMHSAMFYEVTALAFPLALAAMARAIKLRWAATRPRRASRRSMLGLMWIIQLFPATPKLGPIYQHVTHMVTLSFPLLIIVPAFFIDLVMQRFDGKLATLALAADHRRRVRRGVPRGAVAVRDVPHPQSVRARAVVQRREFRLLDESGVRGAARVDSIRRRGRLAASPCTSLIAIGARDGDERARIAARSSG